MVGKLMSRVLERFGYHKFYEPYDKRWTRATLDIDDTPLSQPYRQHAWIYACIRSISTRVASVPLKLYTGELDDPREITEGRLYSIFNRPNSRWSAYHFKEAIATHLMLDGNALITLERERPEAEPLEMFVVSRQRFEPVFKSKSSEVEYWKYRDPKTRSIQRLEPHNVILLPLFNPYNDFWGMGPLEAARQGAEQDWLAQLFNRAFFENSADPGGVLTVKRSSTEQREQWKKQFQDRHMGAGKAFRTLFLEGEAEYKQLGIKHTDMAFVEQRKFGREEIGAVFHVPPSEIGLFDNVQKAIQKAVEKSYFNGTIVPILRLISDMLNAQFFTPYNGEKTWCAFDLSNVEALQDDVDAKVDRAVKLFGMGFPANKINERLELGFEPIEGGDVGYLPIGLRPADMPFNLLQPQAPPAQKAIATPCEIRDAVIEVGKTHTRALTPFSAQHEAYYNEWLAKTANYERLFNGNLRAYLFAVRKYLETQVKIGGDKYGVAGIPEGFLDLPKVYDAKLGAIANKFYNGLKIDIGALIEQHINGANVPFVFEPNDPELLKVIKKKEIKIVLHVNKEAIREGVRKDLVESKRLNETVGELQERIFSRMHDERTRSLTIARTETMQAANALEYKCEQLAGVSTHQWIAALDEKTRSSHLSNMALGPFPINEMFPNGCMYPSDMDGPPREVINCFLPDTMVSGAFVAGSKAFYSGVAVEVVTASGKRLSVTPNHPVLTTGGWKRACRLTESDYLLSDDRRVDRHPAVDGPMNNEEIEPTIEDVFNSFSVQRPAVVGTRDFHGDALSCKREIKIVNAEWELPLAGDTAAFDGIGDSLFEPADRSLDRLGLFQPPGHRFLSSSHRVPGSGALPLDQSTALLDPTPLERFSFGPAAHVDTIVLESAKEHSSADPTLVADLLETHAGFVVPDKVVEIRYFQHTGHVYDLQSKTGWILSQGIVSGNCRCGLMAVE